MLLCGGPQLVSLGNVYKAAGRIGRFKFFLNLTLALALAALAVLTREGQLDSNQQSHWDGQLS